MEVPQLVIGRVVRVAVALMLCAGCGASSDPSAEPTRSAVQASPAPTARPSGATPTAPPTPTASPSALSPRPGRLTARPIGTVEGASLGYLEYVPRGYGDDSPRPLLVFLHGSGQGGNGTADELENLTETAIPALIANGGWPDDLPFVVLMPQHAERQLSPCMEPLEIDAFLDFALESYAVDASRVYLTGVSCGAIGAWMYLSLRRDAVVAAAVPIAGDGRLAAIIAGCELGRVALWALHGSDDEAVPVEGSEQPIRALQQCTEPAPVDARLNILEGEGHNMWQPVYDGSAGHDIYGWLLSHQQEAR